MLILKLNPQISSNVGHLKIWIGEREKLPGTADPVTDINSKYTCTQIQFMGYDTLVTGSRKKKQNNNNNNNLSYL